MMVVYGLIVARWFTVINFYCVEIEEKNYTYNIPFRFESNYLFIWVYLFKYSSTTS